VHAFAVDTLDGCVGSVADTGVLELVEGRVELAGVVGKQVYARHDVCVADYAV